MLAKEALLVDGPDVFFTTPHFDGYPAVLVRLGEITVEDLEEVIVEAWLARAPNRAPSGLRRRAPLRNAAAGYSPCDKPVVGNRLRRALLAQNERGDLLRAPCGSPVALAGGDD